METNGLGAGNLVSTASRSKTLDLFDVFAASELLRDASETLDGGGEGPGIDPSPLDCSHPGAAVRDSASCETGMQPFE